MDGNQKDLTETDKAFEEQRNAAIQEVGKHQSKKFGGGKAVPSNIDRLKESRKAREEKVEGNKASGPASKSNTTQGIYRSLSTDVSTGRSRHRSIRSGKEKVLMVHMPSLHLIIKISQWPNLYKETENSKLEHNLEWLCTTSNSHLEVGGKKCKKGRETCQI